jgi:hypothetical protein
MTMTMRILVIILIAFVISYTVTDVSCKLLEIWRRYANRRKK